MRDVYVTYGNLISSLGDSVETTFSAIEKGISGIRHKSDSGILNNRWPLGYIDGLVENGRFKTLFRQITNSLLPKYGDIILSDRTIVIVSSTKADVFNLPENPFESVSNIIEDVFKPKNQPIFISKLHHTAMNVTLYKYLNWKRSFPGILNIKNKEIN